MKQKIKKVFLWIILIISVVYFVAIFVDLAVHLFFLFFGNAFSLINFLVSIVGLGFFGWIILKLQKKLDVFNFFKKNN